VNLEAGELWPAILRQTRHAMGCGALLPIETTQEAIEDDGVRFVVRMVSSLARKDEQRRARAAVPAGSRNADPFLPCDPDLVVADVSETHLAVLNKFNVIDHHLLIVTREFEPQEALLNEADFAALLSCLAQVDGLGFYNGGTVAGASQQHKHLQIVPFTADGHDSIFPFEPLLADAGVGNGVLRAPTLSFSHALTRLRPWMTMPIAEAAEHVLEHYHTLLAASGLRSIDVNGEPHQSAPYNLLVWREGLLLVPRQAEHAEGISVNSLGFAGAMFVRNAEQLDVLKSLGPMALLRQVAGPAAG
jgi:sulfate adenylyltransferase (ADP) / ATP adenylyltransferase